MCIGPVGIPEPTGSLHAALPVTTGGAGGVNGTAGLALTTVAHGWGWGGGGGGAGSTTAGNGAAGTGGVIRIWAVL